MIAGDEESISLHSLGQMHMHTVGEGIFKNLRFRSHDAHLNGLHRPCLMKLLGLGNLYSMFPSSSLSIDAMG